MGNIHVVLDLHMKIYNGGSPSVMYIYCVVCYCVTAAPCVGSLGCVFTFDCIDNVTFLPVDIS